MSKEFKKCLSVFLVILMVLQMLPLTVLANEKASIEALTPTLMETEPAKIECELEDERDEFSKTYLLEDGTYATYVSKTAIHTESDNGDWQEISEIDTPETMEELQTELSNSATTFSVRSVDESQSITTEYDEMTFQSIGNGLTGVNDDELRIQDYDGDTSQIRSVGYVKINNLNLPDLGDACIVTKATLGAYCSTLPGSENNIVIAQTVEDEWPQANSQVHPLAQSIMDYNAIDLSGEEYYEWDITEAACKWSNKTIDNNGIALVPYDVDCKVSAYVDNIVIYYSVVNELDQNFSFHSVDMGRAGTAYVNDFTNDFYLVRNELSIDGNIMPVSITRTYNNVHKNDSDIAGNGWHWNYDSALSKVTISGVRFFKWVQEDSSVKYFESVNGVWKEQGITEDENGDFSGYIVTEGSDYNIISSEDDVYEYCYGKTNHKLEKIVDKNDKTIVFAYDDNYLLSDITDGVGRTFSFNLGTYGEDSFVNTMSVKDNSGNAIKFDNENLSLSYGYTNFNNTRRFSSVTYSDNKTVNYEYDDNGNMTVVTNIDGTSLVINYDENGKVTEYTKYASDEETVLDKIVFDSSEAYQRIFTDKNNKITRQQYDSQLNQISEISDKDGYFREYDEENELRSISVTEEHTNLLVNEDFSDGLTGWNRPSNRGVEVVTDNDNGFKLSKYDNNVIKLPGKYNAINYAKQTYLFNDDKDHKNEVYTAGVWAKVGGSIPRTDELNNNRTRTVGVLLYGYTNEESGETTELLADITFDNSITDWQYMMVTFKLDKNYDGIQFTLSYNYQIGDVYFDGATLYKGELSEVLDNTGAESVIGCICKNCTELNCPCNCSNEDDCEHIYCKRGTTTVENEFDLTIKETTSDAASKMESTYTYNSDNYYLTESTDTNGITVFYEYDSNTGKLISMATGNEDDKINYAYNAVGLLKTVSQTVTNVMTGEDVNMLTEYTYNGDTLTSIYHNGTTYSYEYDVYGNITNIKVNNIALAEYTYIDGGSNVGSIVYANGNSLIYTYDNSGNILTISTAIISDNGDFENETLKYSYTYSNGSISTITDYVNNTITRYDDNGYQTYLLGDDSTETLIYSYSASENSNSLSYINDGTTIGITNTNNSEDYNINTGKTVYSGTTQIIRNSGAEDANISKTTNNSSEVDYYNRTLSSSFGLGDNTLTNNYTYKTTTDENGNIITSNQVSSSSLMLGAEEYTYTYTYDNAGRLASKSLNGELLISYEYDEAGQIIRENNNEIGETYVYQYDEGGNKLGLYYCEFTEGTVNIDDCEAYDVFEYSNEWSDQISKHNNIDIFYDELGNITDKGDDTYYYWEGRQLVKSRVSSSRYNNYTYNQNGLRTENKITNASGSNTYLDYRYIWNENSQLVSQQLTVSSRTSFNDDYNHSGILPIGSYTTFIIYNELGEAVGFAVDNGTDIKVYYYIKDVTGQINAVVDVETNTIVYSCVYDSWGYILKEYCTNVLVAYCNPLRYKDYNYDISSGLYYLQSRYYEPIVGRFINADDPTLSDTGTKNLLSTNMYVYCESDPVNKIDPTGKFVLLLILSIVLVKQNIINILSPYKKQITASNDYGYSCKYKGKIKIDMQNSGFARDIYDIYRTYKSKPLYNSILFDVLTEFCNEKFNNKFKRNIIFDDLGISNEIKEHVLGYLWAIGYSVTPPPLMYTYCKGSKSKMKEHCSIININESDVYNVIQRTNFAYSSHIRIEYMASRKDPFYYPSTHVRIAVPNNNWKNVEMK